MLAHAFQKASGWGDMTLRHLLAHGAPDVREEVQLEAVLVQEGGMVLVLRVDDGLETEGASECAPVRERVMERSKARRSANKTTIPVHLQDTHVCIHTQTYPGDAEDLRALRLEVRQRGVEGLGLCFVRVCVAIRRCEEGEMNQRQIMYVCGYSFVLGRARLANNKNMAVASYPWCSRGCRPVSYVRAKTTKRFQ